MEGDAALYQGSEPNTRPQIRVTWIKRDDLQTVIQFLRSKDFGIALALRYFRD
jgi:uncharacterized protein YajQ (UPF0234 family)